MRNAIRRRVGAPAGPGRYVLGSALILAILVAPFAVASGEGDPIEGGTRNPSNNKSAALTRETGILTENGTYGTRQSNKKKGDGGGAIYGCRSAPGHEPCVRANNLENGRAFEFATSNGTEGGFIDVGSGPVNTKAVPFNTNAAARVANLNADRVDDLHASEIVAQAKDLWAVVTADGGLSRKNAAVASAAKLATGEYEVVFDRDVTACAYNVSIGSSDTTEPALGESAASQRAGNVKAVAVVTADSAGTKADRPFHLTVNC
jgi:hypothetical protein